jgi:hypothetical protein
MQLATHWPIMAIIKSNFVIYEASKLNCKVRGEFDSRSMRLWLVVIYLNWWDLFQFDRAQAG